MTGKSEMKRRQDRPVAAQAGGGGDPRGPDRRRLNDARAKAEAKLAEKMRELTGGLSCRPA